LIPDPPDDKAIWRETLPTPEVVRQALPRDRLALQWLLATSRWAFRAAGQEDVGDLIRQKAGYVWQRGQTLQAALLVSLYRQPVATARYLVLREESGRAKLITHVLPLWERYLRDLEQRWLAFHDCPAWLENDLTLAGYRQQAVVIGYMLKLSAAQRLPTADGVCRAGPQDSAQVLALDEAAFEAFWRLNADLVAAAPSNSAYYLVAERQGQLVGYLMAERWSERAYLSRIGVLPEWQGQGIGAQLLQAALAMMQQDGVRQVLLNTQEDNARSRALYERLGFTPTGQSEVFWSKALVTEIRPAI
jgi:ribosomal-protein-alanine N-acetyltransferase